MVFIIPFTTQKYLNGGSRNLSISTVSCSVTALHSLGYTVVDVRRMSDTPRELLQQLHSNRPDVLNRKHSIRQILRTTSQAEELDGMENISLPDTSGDHQMVTNFTAQDIPTMLRVKSTW